MGCICLPKSEVVPGIRAMMDGWLKEWENCVTVIAEFADATVRTVL